MERIWRSSRFHATRTTMRTRLLVLVAITFLLTSCVGGASPAELATYEAIAPEYSTYIVNDMSLSAEQKQRRATTIETWRLRVGGAR
jgi:hypothetical protein